MDRQIIFSCPLCSHVPVHKRETFLENILFKERHFKKGDLIAYQGEKIEYLYILLKGSVKTEMITESGTVVNIETISAPHPLASAFVFAENNTFPVDVIALEACDLMLISKDSVLKQMVESQEFLQAYIKHNSGRTQFLSERIKLLSIKTIKGKIAFYILERAQNNAFKFDISQTALADYFGVTRPSLSRSLSEMTADGIISFDKKEGKILQPNKLRELIMN